MNRSRIALSAILCLVLGYAAYAQTHSNDPALTSKETPVTHHATGTFEVKIVPQPSEDKDDDKMLSRSTLDKQFHGDLEGASKGQGLFAATSVKGSAGYVAIEKVTGKLQGRSGTFVLQHSGTMAHGSFQLSVTV